MLAMKRLPSINCVFSVCHYVKQTYTFPFTKWNLNRNFIYIKLTLGSVSSHSSDMMKSSCTSTRNTFFSFTQLHFCVNTKVVFALISCWIVCQECSYLSPLATSYLWIFLTPFGFKKSCQDKLCLPYINKNIYDNIEYFKLN